MYEKMNELVTSAYERGLNDGKKNKQVDKEFQAMLLTGLSLKDLVVEEK